MTDNQQTLEIEQALTGMVKLMKAMRFYPEGHPSLQSVTEDCMTGFTALLMRPDNQAIQSNQSGFSLGDVKIGEQNPALPDLAHLLAERRVNQLIFLPGLPAHELLTFLQGLATPAEEIYSLGGLPIFLKDRKVASIWLNESSLDSAHRKRQELTAEIEQAEATEEQTPSVPIEKIDLRQQLREVMGLLNSDLQDDTYRQQVDKLLQLAPLYFEQSGVPGTLRILPLLLIQSQQEERSPEQRQLASAALDRLLSVEIASLILAQFKEITLNTQQFQRLQKLIVALGMRIAPQLLTLMSKEEDATVRKRLNTLLGKMGEPLLGLLQEMLSSDQWYIVRNAVTLIGDLRLDAGLNALVEVTKHPDQRVRRTLIRSLSMIGGKKSVAPLLKLTQDPVTTLRRPAVKALGATRSLEAVKPLLKIAQTFDPFAQQVEIRSDAVAALGTLGMKEAIFPLLALARRPNLLRLRQLEEFRAEIILALGKLGDKNLDAALRRWQKSPHGVVQRATELSLTTLLKKHDNATSN